MPLTRQDLEQIRAIVREELAAVGVQPLAPAPGPEAVDAQDAMRAIVAADLKALRAGPRSSPRRREDHFIDQGEAARVCNTELQTIAAWARLGLIRSCKRGRRVLVHRDDVRAIAERESK